LEWKNIFEKISNNFSISRKDFPSVRLFLPERNYVGFLHQKIPAAQYIIAMKAVAGR